MIIARYQIMPNIPDDTDIPERMAEVILKIIEQRGQCSVFDLKAKGFSFDEIACYWPDASALAEEKTKRHVPCLPKH